MKKGRDENPRGLSEKLPPGYPPPTRGVYAPRPSYLPREILPEEQGPKDLKGTPTKR